MSQVKVKLEMIFFGTPDFAVPALEALIRENYNIVAAITQPDKPVGRKQVLSPPPVKIFAEQQGIKVLQPKTLKAKPSSDAQDASTTGDNETFETFKLLSPGICIVAAYGKIIPKRYLDVPKYGFINIHPSLLPKYRGPSPIQTAILNGDPALQRADAYGKTNRSLSDGAGTETGVTIILMDDQIDHGPILAQKTYNLQPTTYNTQASEELFTLGAKLLVEILPKYISGEIKPEEQDHSQATFTKMFTREDGRINWNEPAEKIYNRIRALNPEPGTWTTWKEKIINIKAASVKTSASNGKPILEIEIIQMEGKKEMPFKEFLNGYPDFNISQLV